MNSALGEAEEEEETTQPFHLFVNVTNIAKITQRNGRQENTSLL